MFTMKKILQSTTYNV